MHTATPAATIVAGIGHRGRSYPSGSWTAVFGRAVDSDQEENDAI
ncbi:MAG: hypothetical protein JWO18_1669 [Microbacteriaceae bacterium]|jgi:hypothetical protein|nr:hypothetical protein [Microbacteriaceae bacterium]